MATLTMLLDPARTRDIMDGHLRVIFKERSPKWENILRRGAIDRVRVRSDEAAQVEVTVACRGVLPAIRRGQAVYAICLGGRA